MAETPEAPHTHEGGFKHFMTATTGPLPNWVWLLVIGGTLGAVYIVPKFLGGTSASSSNSNTPAPSSLAIDPTTGLPYATEGLIPAGGSVSPGNGTSADMSTLYQELAAQQQQNTTLLTLLQNWFQSFSHPTQPTQPTPQPGRLPYQGPKPTIPKPTATDIAALREQYPNLGSVQLLQLWNQLHAPHPIPLTALTGQYAVSQWQQQTGQTWTGPTGSFPTGYGVSGAGEGVIQQGQFKYITPPTT